MTATLAVVSADERATGATSAGNSNPPAAAAAFQRRREGDRLDQQLGSFRQLDGQVVFVTLEDKAEFSVLPNLNLERIERLLGDSPERSIWKVTGTITEYRGANWLLISRAARKNSRP
jgi:hypothetical protein